MIPVGAVRAVYAHTVYIPAAADRLRVLFCSATTSDQSKISRLTFYTIMNPAFPYSGTLLEPPLNS